MLQGYLRLLLLGVIPIRIIRGREVHGLEHEKLSFGSYGYFCGADFGLGYLRCQGTSNDNDTAMKLSYN